MKLTNKTFNSTIKTLHNAYLNWELPDSAITVWKNILALSISDEFLPKVILDWMLTMTEPPKNPAEIIKHANEMVIKEYGSAESEVEILIDSVRNVYSASEDYYSFLDKYEDSFSSGSENSYILNNIKKYSGRPSVLIFVYYEYEGALKDCFRGDAGHGIEFLRTQIKKCWQSRATDCARRFLISGETEVIRPNYRNVITSGNHLVQTEA